VSKSGRTDFVSLNRKLTSEVVARLDAAGDQSAVIVEAPPGAGKSTLTASVAKTLTDADADLQLPIVTQTNEQADDLVASLTERYPKLDVARIVGGSGPSERISALADQGRVKIASKADDYDTSEARVLVSTARKWQYERSRLQADGGLDPYAYALIDEAYQMRSDALLGIADLYKVLLCVGDPGQLDPFTVIDDSVWKGLPYSPSRAALGTLRGFHPDVEPLIMRTSWRLPPSAAGIVSRAFYPAGAFEAGTAANVRKFELGRPVKKPTPSDRRFDETLDQAASSGWAYVELPERLTVRTDQQLASELAGLTSRLLSRKATVVDERNPNGVQLTPARVALICAHNDQVLALRLALNEVGVDPDEVIVSTANRIQGREYDVTLVWHPLAGRRDATKFHLEAGRMCVMLSRHRHACIVVGRGGALRLLEEFPDSDPMFLGEPEKFPDGWQANHDVLKHLEHYRVFGRDN
jgi:hypothetical protein